MAAPKSRRVKLREFAFARSGDKGDGSNVGLFVRTGADYELIRKQVTAAAVKRHFRAICFGEVTRYEAPNMLALNFLLHGLALLELEVVRPIPAKAAAPAQKRARAGGPKQAKARTAARRRAAAKRR
jgi:hypothetical protein